MGVVGMGGGTNAMASASRPRRVSAALTGLVLVLPAVVLLLGLTLYPVVYGAWISAFNKHSFFPEQTFVGLANYAYVLSDPGFWDSVRLGTIYALSSIALQVA